MSPSRRPQLIDPALARHFPALRRVLRTAVLLGALGAVAIVVQAVALATAVDRSLLHHATMAAVAPDLAVLFAALVGRGVIAFAAERAPQRATAAMVATLQASLLEHALDLGPAWLAGQRTGELALTATRGIRILHDYVTRYVPQAATAAVVPPLLLVWIASRDWLSLLVVLALVAAVPVTMVYFGREAARRTARQWRRLGSLATRFLQLIEGLPTLRAFGRDAHGRREVSEASEAVRVATMRTLRVAFLSALAMDLLAGFGVGLVAMALGLRLLWGDLTLTTALGVLLVAPEVFGPLRRAGSEFHASTEGQAAAARVLDILAVPLPPAGAAAVASVPAPTAPTAPAGERRARPTLRLSNLRIDYEDRTRPAVEGVSLHVPPGARVAIVGPSGAGKSSVLAALLGFVRPSAGTLALDDIGPADVTWWRTHFSWVPQRPYLFDTTLAANLRLGSPAAPDAELRAVVDAVGLGRLVDHLALGMDTDIGPDGVALSEGERQRVALARALVRPAPILLFDEPTSSLDPGTASALMTAIEPWVEGRSVIVAAHEPLLLPHFDQVVELDGAVTSVAAP
ncbi:MAG TPA: thiol reductant ABC exporter subunit CydD [Acidimicrobiales bacterium]|nr:thiol reductant ABC exporter subunit CydD [Acidimicrobiales bacterium]